MGFQEKYTFIPLPFNFAQRNQPHALAEEGSTLVSSTDSPAFTSQCDQKPASLKESKDIDTIILRNMLSHIQVPKMYSKISYLDIYAGYLRC